MLGDGVGGSQPGIVPKLCDALFASIAELKAREPTNEFLVLCSYLELYNEVRPGAGPVAPGPSDG